MMEILLTIVLVVVPVFFMGCQNQEKQASPVADVARSHGGPQVTTIEVPASVRVRWKAVGIAVIDKATARQNVYNVPVDGKITIPSSSMTIRVEAFLPSFIKEGATITSRSDELRNPAAKVLIKDGNNTVFNGWLFAKYPNTHAYLHPRYGFTLIDVVPAGR